MKRRGQRKQPIPRKKHRSKPAASTQDKRTRVAHVMTKMRTDGSSLQHASKEFGIDARILFYNYPITIANQAFTLIAVYTGVLAPKYRHCQYAFIWAFMPMPGRTESMGPGALTMGVPYFP
jgi:hypothetical protein